VIVIEPSGFRTDWAGSSMTVRPIPEDYEKIFAWCREGGGVTAGDPDRAAEILVQVAKRRDIPRNLPLGVNATEGSIRLDQEHLAEDRKWSAVSRSADFAESYPVELPTTGKPLPDSSPGDRSPQQSARPRFVHPISESSALCPHTPLRCVRL
jgi:hypothetical protein